MTYTLTFETCVICIQGPVRLEATAIKDAEGHGLWQLATTDHGTEIYYTWTVRTTKGWMNSLTEIVHSLMEWNHNVIMERGKGLAAHLKAELISIASADQNRSVVSAVSS